MSGAELLVNVKSMPIRTEHFLLEAFLDGDSYSSLADRRRFSTIDNQMYRVAEIVGDGVIDGWEITSQTFPDVLVTAGGGLVDGYYVNTFDDQLFTLSDNGTFYFYAQRKVGIIGSEGPKSDLASVTYVDTGPPADPTSLIISTPAQSSTRYKFDISLQWTGVSDIDLSHYQIQRSKDGGVYEIAGTAYTIYYEDKVDENAVYDYRIYAVDQSSNLSTGSADGLVSVTLSDSLPPNPIEVEMHQSEAAINVLWNRPPAIDFTYIDHWLISYIELDTDNEPILSTILSFVTNKALYNDRIDDLLIGRTYQVTLQSVDGQNRHSTGVVRNVVPQPSPAPRDPEGVAYTLDAGEFGVRVSLSWTSGDTPYDPALSYRYKIYPRIGDLVEAQSIDIPPGLTEEQVSLYTFNGSEYFSIPENTLVTFRITALDVNGFESVGTYIRLITAQFTLPKSLGNAQTEFDFDTSDLVITWTNQDDTDDVNVRIVVEELDADDAPIEVVNENVGRANRYVYDSAETDKKYTVYLTPINSDDVEGSPSVSVEITLGSGNLPLPDPPNSVESKASDKQILLTWDRSDTNYTNYYNLYRKTGDVTFNTEDWLLLDIMPVAVTRFIDFGLENDQAYSYYITATDVYGRESDNLGDGAVNLNFTTAVPRAEGALTEPTAVAALVGKNIEISWDALLEEFDSYTIYRTINNLHTWESIAHVDRNTFTYLDENVPLVDGTTFYYVIDKTINDADIVVQSTGVSPPNSVCLGHIALASGVFGTPDTDCRRDIQDMADPLGEYTFSFILDHKHRGIKPLDPDRVDLNAEIIVTDWTTVDGRIWFTQENIQGGTHIVKVNNRFPKEFFEVDEVTGRIIFSEAINISSAIEMRVLGIEEVQNVLDEFRFDEIHAKQIQFGELNFEQLPDLNHEGRVRELMFPKRYLLERYNNHNFIVPQGNTDATKTFGNGTTFYATIDSDGRIKEIIDFDTYDDNLMVGFQTPSYSTDTILHLKQSTAASADLESGNDISNIYEFVSDTVFCFTQSYNKVLQAYDWSTNTFNQIRDMGGDLTAANNRVISVDISRNSMYIGGTTDGNQGLIYTVDPATGRILHTQIIEGIFDTISHMHETVYNEDEDIFYVRDDSIWAAAGEVKYCGESTDWVLMSFGTPIYNSLLKSTYVSSTQTIIDQSDSSNLNPGTFSSRISLLYRSIYHLTGAHDISQICQLTSSSAILTYDPDNQGFISTSAGGDLLSLTNFNTTGAGSCTETSLSTPAETLTALLRMPEDSWWVSNPDTMKVGHFGGLVSHSYLRFPVDIATENTISTAILNLTGYASSGGSFSMRVSVLDPSEYVDSIDASDDALSTISSLASIVIYPDTIVDGSQVEINVYNLINEFVNNNAYYPGRHVVFKFEALGPPAALTYREYYAYNSGSDPRLNLSYVVDTAEVNSDPGGYQSEKAYRLQWEFEDTAATRWVRISTKETALKPNPVIDLVKRLRFKVKLNTGSLYMGFGIREITQTGLETGENGGIVGPIEWVNVNNLLTDDNGNITPIGSTLITASDEWQEVDIDLQKATAFSLQDGDGVIGRGLGVLEHIAFTVNPDNPPTEAVDVFIDKLEQVDDLLVAGTSQGIQTSGDFGVNWRVSRLTDTPVHSFYRAENNNFMWAITGTEVLFAVDPEFWFATGGTTGVQFIKDITEDAEGNMYVSTDKGVYFLEIGLIYRLANFKQTTPINAFTTDCYGMFHYHASSGQDEIWASTEIGIFKTVDHGDTWIDSGLNTSGLVAYQFMDVSDSLTNPVIICITRKHVMRKRLSDADFEVIANFEAQHGIFDIWKMEYFGGRLYISTGDGLYANLSGSIFNDSEIEFEKVFTDLNMNNDVLVCFGLDKARIEEDVYQMFVGQENRLMMITEDLVLSTKKEYRNRELPSFYVDNNVVTIGYVYNAFNGVVTFREPQSVVDVVSAAHLPRKSFVANEGGWAMTNPESEIFLYRNGFPTWLYFKLDENEVVAEVQLIGSRINSLPELTTFNSLYPESSELKTATLSNITTIISGGENETSLVNNATVTAFLANYIRFLSVITNTLKSGSSLTDPEIIVSGIRRFDGDITSRSALLEAQEDFESEESFGITVDAFAGEIDFLQAFTTTTDPEEREKLSFDKFDRLEITLFNTQIANTGEFTHREIEDNLEDYNTGMTSHMGRVFNTNLIKTGIFLEQQHNYVFDRYNASNVQSKFYAAHTNSWYDQLNSTVDYVTLVRVLNHPEPRYVYDSYLFINDPYFGGRLWIATDNDIIQYVFDSNGELVVEDIVRPGGGVHPMTVTDIYVTSSNSVYVVASEQASGRSHIYLTYNFGVTWEDLETINLPSEFETFVIINNNKVVLSEEGTFYSDNDFGTWYPSNVTRAFTVGEDAERAFKERVRKVEKDTFLILESDRYFYTSGSGIEFLAVGRIKQNTTVVNTMARFKSLLWVGTDHGLYNDGNSALSDSIQFGLANNLEETATESAAVVINDITSSTDILYCCSAEGKIYRFWNNPDDESNENEWSRYKVHGFDSIHKLHIYETASKTYLVVMAYNQIKSVDVTPGEGVFG